MQKQGNNSSFKPKLQKAKAKFFKTYYSNPAKDLKIIAVTGEKGRDITAHYIHEILKTRDSQTGLIIDPTSTSSLYKQLFKIWKTGTNYAVVSVAASGLANHLFYGMPIYAAVITDNLSPDSDSSLNRKEDSEAKAILFNKEPFFSIINRDDVNYSFFAKYKTKTATLSYGTDRDADLRINRSKLYKLGTEANLSYKAEKFDVATFIVGEEAVNYMAAAALTAFACELGSDAIVDGIANYED